MLQKSRSLKVDLAVYDLEDSVAPHLKKDARMAVAGFLDETKPDGIREQAVRINSVDSGHALQDLIELVSLERGARLWTIMNFSDSQAYVVKSTSSSNDRGTKSQLGGRSSFYIRRD